MKRILSVILAISLMLTMLAGATLSAFAEDSEIISEVTVVSPLPEDIAAGEAIIAPEITVAEPSCTVEAIWLDSDGNEATGTFEDGSVYWLSLKFTAQDGYAFDTENGAEVWFEDGFEWAESPSDSSWAETRIRYSLLEEIDTIEFDGVTEPELGEAPTLEGITVPEDANYYIEATSSYWYDLSTDSYDFETFGKGRYQLYLDVYANDGYEISENVTVTVNGAEIYDFGSNFEGVWIYPVYSLLDKIDVVELSGVKEAVLGEEATVEDITVPEDADYYIADAAWYDINYEIFTGIFEEKNSYELSINLCANDGYEFTEETVFYVNGEEVGWYTDGAFTADAYGTDAYVYGSFSFTISAADIDLPAFPEEVPLGEEYIMSEDSAIYEEEYMCVPTWLVIDENGELVSVEGIFEEGKVYLFGYILMPESGYDFEDTKITVDGKTPNGAFDMAIGNIATFFKMYNLAGLTEIDKVEITVPVPEIGAEIDYEAYTIPEDAGYALDLVSWTVSEDGELMNYVDAEGEFEEDMYYIFAATLSPLDGYIFSDNVVVTVNGEVSDLSAITEVLGIDAQLMTPVLGVAYSDFGKLTAPEPVPEPTPEPEPEPAPEPTPEEEPEETPEDIVPTGDTFSALPIAIVMVIALVGICSSAILLKKKSR